MMRRFLIVPLVAVSAASAQQPVTLSLGDAARLAAQQSAPALTAELRTREAEARVAERRADLFPSISTYALESGHTVNTATFGFDFPAAPGEKPLLDPNGQIIGPVNTLDLRGRVNIPAIDFAARARVNSARAVLRATEAQARSAAEQAAATAANAYLRVSRADALLSARAADSVLADTLLMIANAQLSAGVGVALDVTRARSQIAAIHSQIIAARGEQARSRLDLVRAIGAPLETPVVLRESLDRLATDDAVPSESEAVAIAMRERADVVAAQRAVEAGQESIRAVRAERLPTLGAFADDGMIGTSLSHLLNTYAWGVQISLPVFDGMRRSARTREQQAQTDQLLIQRRELERQVTVDVRSALVDLATARDQVSAARGRLSLAEQEYSQATDRFRAGVAGNADVIAAALALNGARNGVIDALASYQAARVSLARAEGTATRLP
jgi:outer membrane protein TolC